METYRLDRRTLLFLLLAGVAQQRTSSATQHSKRRGWPSAASAQVFPKTARIKSIRILQESGARPRFSPDGKLVVFDRYEGDGFADVFICNLQGEIVASLTDGREGINQRHNGNARFDPSGRFVVFTSESSRHFGRLLKPLGDPGVGLYSNFYATGTKGRHFWQLTDIPIKRRLTDRVPSFASVNPVFGLDGRTFVWTERYAEGGHHNWGKWRLKAADFIVEAGRPRLRDERVLFTPEEGNYVTAMGFVDSRRLLVAGNLDGQHEYGMDLYVLEAASGRFVNLTNSPSSWDEDGAVARNGQIIYMSNRDSRYRFDRARGDWFAQPVQREYYMMDSSGKRTERLTRFNDPEAAEYVGKRVLVAASDFSPDGRYLAGTMGVDQGRGPKREDVRLQVILLELAKPFS
ncbi:MAG: hypothetical protein GEV06_18255 [Luteitalea sp.]|nr:hypothetical protein [Luteitalea sp.]